MDFRKAIKEKSRRNETLPKTDNEGILRTENPTI
jgi:hypothetical protein